MTVHYEWDIETISLPEADILDHDHRATLAEFDADDLREAIKALGDTRLVLVRDVGNDADGLTDRSWAYVEKGKLPERFAYCPGEGASVPVRFVKELERHT